MSPSGSCWAFATAAHCGGLDDLFSCHEVGLASEDGHLGHRGYVTDLLARMLDGDDSYQRGRLWLRAAPDAAAVR